MSRALLLSLLLAAFVTANAGATLVPPAQAPLAPPLEAPAAARWLNSEPLELSDLRGKVVLVDFFTADCWNCYRSIPWLKTLEAGLSASDFRVLGVHTPEFEREKDIDYVRSRLVKYGVEHPVVTDNEHHIWQAWRNRYWPAFYLVDREGRVRAQFVGETHAGDAQARAVEAAIAQLMAEGSTSISAPPRR